MCAVWSDIGETPYKLFPLVHISKLKKVKTYLDRPTHMLRVTEADRIGFDEAIQPKDSWKNNLKDNELEVKKIANVRSGQKTRIKCIYRPFRSIGKNTVIQMGG